ncbi:MAG: outer membrane protein assembly factor BamE, partial [Rhodospirillales bacterium]|nr:outer membrane protein assembly factor BamE [Rhodospirillales bacterium]
DPADLAKLVPGTTTETQTRDLIGSPSSGGTFIQNDWYYITQETRQTIGGTQGVHDQSVIVLAFDQGGVLRGIKRIDRKDALAAPIVARTTPSPGGTTGFFQQLLGNVGRIGPDMGEQGGGSPGGAPIH